VVSPTQLPLLAPAAAVACMVVAAAAVIMFTAPVLLPAAAAATGCVVAAAAVVLPAVFFPAVGKTMNKPHSRSLVSAAVGDSGCMAPVRGSLPINAAATHDLHSATCTRIRGMEGQVTVGNGSCTGMWEWGQAYLWRGRPSCCSGSALLRLAALSLLRDRDLRDGRVHETGSHWSGAAYTTAAAVRDMLTVPASAARHDAQTNYDGVLSTITCSA
jgi:hypothetical protein